MTQEIYNVLTEIGYSLTDYGKDWRTKPLYRDSGNNSSLSISKRNGRWVDYSACIGGNLEELIKITLNLKTLDEAKNWVANKVDLTRIEDTKPTIKQAKIYSNDLLKELLPVHNYWLDRGITRKTLEEFKGGLVKSGQMMDRYTFPIFNSKNQIVGFIGRDIRPESKTRPKYKIIGNKSKWVWPATLNKGIIRSKKAVILVESPACVLRCWDMGIKNVICIFGVKISTDIICFLLKINCQKIIISTNNEPDNNSIGNNAAEEIKNTLLNFFDANQVLINLPVRKDIAEMTDEEIINWNNINI